MLIYLLSKFVMFQLSTIPLHLSVRQLECWFTCLANLQYSGSIPYLYTIWYNSYNVSAQFHTHTPLGTTATIFQLSSILIHFWVQQLQCFSSGSHLYTSQYNSYNVPAQYHTHTSLDAIARVLIFLLSKFTIFQFSIILIHLLVQQLECWFLCLANS